MSESGSQEYRRVLKVTALLGGTRVLTMVVGLARAKGLALTVGAAGVGLLGFGEVALTFMVYLLGLGVSSSGVRFIALAREEGGMVAAAAVARTVRRLSLGLGLVAGICWTQLWRPVSGYSLGYTEGSLRWLAPAIAFVCLTCANRGCLQGLQSSRLVAFATLGDAVALLIGVVTAALIGGKAYLLAGYAVGAAVSCLLSEALLRRALPSRAPEDPQKRGQAGIATILKLGVGMTSGLLASTALLYAVQTLVTRGFGLDGLGLYLCAFALSGKAVGFILEAMNLDFFPNLSRAAHDPDRANRLISQQTEILLLLALPGLLLTLGSAQLLVHIFYSAEFAPAVPILHIFVLGAFFRVLGTPLGMIRIGRGQAGLYLVTEWLNNLFTFACIWGGTRLWGLPGIAWGYVVGNFGQFAAHTLVCRLLTGFQWRGAALRLALSGAIVLALALAGLEFLPGETAAAASLCLALIAGCFTLLKIGTLLDPTSSLACRLRSIPFLGNAFPAPRLSAGLNERT